MTIELVALLALLALSSGTRWIDASTPKYLPAIQALGSSVVPPAAGVLVLALLTRRWRVGAAAALLAVLQLASSAGWWIAGDNAVSEGDGALVVMAANLQYGRADTDVLVSQVRALDVDVLVLTELTSAAAERLEASGLRQQLPATVGQTREDAGGTAVFSRHDLRVDDTAAAPALWFETVAVTVDAPSGPVTVLAAHPVPPWPGHTALWHAELAALSDWAGRVDPDRPLIVAGDFNAGSAHPVFRRFFRSGLYDAHHESGGGVVATWPRLGRSGTPSVPVLHLDHVLVRGLGVSATGTTVVSGSDHDAVWAKLRPMDV